MTKVQQLLDAYGESHQNWTNKLIHWFCVPGIMFSLMGMLYAIPFPGGRSLFGNWAAIVILLALVYYLRLSLTLFFGFLIIGGLLVWGNHALFQAHGMGAMRHFYISLGIFVVFWIGQFIGHKIEGKKPSFLEDIQFLLVGPAWLLHFIYKKLGIPYQ